MGEQGRGRGRGRNQSSEDTIDETVDQGVSETWSVTRRMPVFSAYFAMDMNNCWYLQ